MSTSDTRVMLEDVVTKLFGGHVTKERVESAERGEWLGDLWSAVEDAGLTRPHLGEAVGGAGGSWLEAYVILHASGRHTVPLPIAETMLAGWLLERAGLDVPPGPISVSPGVVAVECLTDGRLTATVSNVPWGRFAPHLVFVTAEEGPGCEVSDVRVGLVATSSGTVRDGENLAREPRDGLVFEGVPVEALEPAIIRPDAVWVYGAMMRSAQMAGALDALLAQSVQYAGERVQFGRPIAAFQVIQHELAKLAGDVASSGMASEAAFHAAACGAADPRFEIAVAKTLVGGVVDQATSIAHQVHGAIGFTYEHGLHFATRRLWAWRAEFGTDSHWAAELGRAAIAEEPEALWPRVTGRPGA
jgi:acyl-CoA dehydrogenase